MKGVSASLFLRHERDEARAEAKLWRESSDVYRDTAEDLRRQIADLRMSGDAYQQAYAMGQYDQLKRLTTSPRFNKTARALIEDEAWTVKRKLEDMGVRFAETADDR